MPTLNTQSERPTGEKNPCVSFSLFDAPLRTFLSPPDRHRDRSSPTTHANRSSRLSVSTQFMPPTTPHSVASLPHLVRLFSSFSFSRSSCLRTSHTPHIFMYFQGGTNQNTCLWGSRLPRRELCLVLSLLTDVVRPDGMKVPRDILTSGKRENNRPGP